MSQDNAAAAPSAADPGGVEEKKSVAPLTEITGRSKEEEEEENNSNKWEEICIGFWRQTRLRRKNNEPGECFGINIVLHKQ